MLEGTDVLQVPQETDNEHQPLAFLLGRAFVRDAMGDAEGRNGPFVEGGVPFTT